MATTPKCDVLNNFGGYSKTYGGGGHQGVDIGSALGQEVYAVEDGVLYRQFTDLGSAAGYGWGLIGLTDTQYRYYHLSAFVPGLAEGDTVRQGELIGYVGDTGNATPGGYHLHFEVRPGPAPYSKPVDPVPLLAIPRNCKVYPKSEVRVVQARRSAADMITSRANGSSWRPVRRSVRAIALVESSTRPAQRM